VTLGGWVHRSRDLGALVFLDLRDRDGLVQVSFDSASVDAETSRPRQRLASMSVVIVEGRSRSGRARLRNTEMATGEVEVRGTALA
jgi:aspartyl-tRNA synthetase